MAEAPDPREQEDCPGGEFCDWSCDQHPFTRFNDARTSGLMLSDLNVEPKVIAAVLAEHVRGDWSDRTYACGGCRKRFEKSTQERWENGTDEERRAIRAELNKHIKPDWTLDEYNAHVAAAIAAALNPPIERVCDHPGVDHDDSWSYCWPCPKCGVCKFIGHGPLCGDCALLPPADVPRCPCTRWDYAKDPNAPDDHPWEPGPGKCPDWLPVGSSSVEEAHDA